MMKHVLISIPLSLTASLLFSQNISSTLAQPDTSIIIKKIRNAVDLASTQGSYIFSDKHILMRAGEDTNVRISKYKCFFKKNDSDTLLSFKLSSYSIKRNNQDKIYDGENVYIQTGWNKKLEILSKNEIPKSLSQLKAEASFYPFFIKLGNDFIAFEKSNKQDIRLISTDSVNETPCFKFEFGQTRTNAAGNTTEIYYHVSSKTFLPIQQTVIFKRKVGQVAETEIFEYTAESFQNGYVEDSIFSRNLLTDYLSEGPYGLEKNVTNTLLGIGQTAPDWELPSLSNKMVKLSDFKDKIIILDFWYKACTPCLNQMLDLQKIHAEYKGKNVVMIGINTIDDPQREKLEAFLEKRNVASQTVYNGYKIQSAYKAILSPVLYVIDKKGKICYAKDGYSKNLIDDLHEVLDLALK
ncbi:MAG: TlpA disulfide reductase family protein [Bacteroidota bacterium]